MSETFIPGFGAYICAQIRCPFLPLLTFFLRESVTFHFGV